MVLASVGRACCWAASVAAVVVHVGDLASFDSIDLAVGSSVAVGSCPDAFGLVADSSHFEFLDPFRGLGTENRNKFKEEFAMIICCVISRQLFCPLRNCGRNSPLGDVVGVVAHLVASAVHFAVDHSIGSAGSGTVAYLAVVDTLVGPASLVAADEQDERNVFCVEFEELVDRSLNFEIDTS